MRFHYLLLALLAPVLAWSQQQAAVPSVRASAEAVVYAKPDRARIDIGVATQATTAQAAATQNAAKAQTVIEKLRAAIGGNGQVEHVGYSLSPDYRYPEHARPVLVGFTATSAVAVTTQDLALVARMIDVATAVGATDVRQVRFSAKNVTAARSDAIRQATRIARGYAEALAAAQGVKLGRVLSLEEAAPSDWEGPSTLNSVSTAGQGETLAVRASVVATFAIE
jgi:uncharacterized protein YggE